MSATARGRFTIVNERGLHARAASKLVALASSFPCEITLSNENESAVTAKSVMGVLLLCGARGTWLDVEAVGERAAEAVEAIGRLVASRFGEDG
ncbi:MAG: HPr family phosphocarrier protein [Deltaproteobacteria bacterium]|nr:HPr family phosphocarrier protein [Deltaproteobacteria bacterium]